MYQRMLVEVISISGCVHHQGLEYNHLRTGDVTNTILMLNQIGKSILWTVLSIAGNLRHLTRHITIQHLVLQMIPTKQTVPSGWYASDVTSEMTIAIDNTVNRMISISCGYLIVLSVVIILFVGIFFIGDVFEYYIICCWLLTYNRNLTNGVITVNSGNSYLIKWKGCHVHSNIFIRLVSCYLCVSYLISSVLEMVEEFSSYSFFCF